MELVITIPILLAVIGGAVAMALKQPLPPAASTAFVAAGTQAGLRRAQAGVRPRAGDKEPMAAPQGARPTPSDIEGRTKEMVATFSQTDVLLADALTEMIGMKAELYRLRNKVDTLNVEVARLSGSHLRPLPPASQKKPEPLRRAA